METKQPVTNEAELNERLATLPVFSYSVYAAIKKGLYAEPFFSDVTVKDIAEAVCAPTTAVRAAVKHLIAEGLVFTEQYDANNSNRVFIHTYEHDGYQQI